MSHPCFHCSLATPANSRFHQHLMGSERVFCCGGCMAVAETIVNQGLGDYYLQRQRPALTQSDLEQLSSADEDLDHPAVQAEFVHTQGDQCQAELVLSGMTCTACSWLIERQLRRLKGITAASVNFSTQRLLLGYTRSLPLSQIVLQIEKLGYHARPFIAR